MILKRRPEDFRVWEECSLPVADHGPYGVYLLKKRNLTTPGALRRASRALGLPDGAFRSAGLKDRRSVSEQVVTVRSPRDCSGRWQGVALRLVGRSSRHVGPGDICRNRFEVVVRDLEAGEVERVLPRAKAAGRRGFPNYFDDQRFGSVREQVGFAGESLVKREWAAALRVLVASPGPQGLAPEARHRAALRERWGDWQACRELAADRGERAAFEALCADGRAFRRAVNLLSRDVLAIHLAAWQSHWWNAVLRVLAERVARAAAPGTAGRGESRLDVFPGLVGAYLFPAEEEGPGGSFPATVPTLGRGVCWGGRSEVEAVYLEVLAPRGLRPEDFVLRRLPKVSLRSSERAAVPGEWSAESGC